MDRTSYIQTHPWLSGRGKEKSDFMLKMTDSFPIQVDLKGSFAS